MYFGIVTFWNIDQSENPKFIDHMIGNSQDGGTLSCWCRHLTAF